MCGRYAFNADADADADDGDVYGQFRLAERPDPILLTSRYNVAPTQLVPVIAAKADGVTRKLGNSRGAWCRIGRTSRNHFDR